MAEKHDKHDKREKKVKKSLVSLVEIDYKNIRILKKFIGPREKLLSKKLSGLSAKKQRKLTREVKKARIMGLLPFTDRHALS